MRRANSDTRTLIVAAFERAGLKRDDSRTQIAEEREAVFVAQTDLILMMARHNPAAASPTPRAFRRQASGDAIRHLLAIAEAADRLALLIDAGRKTLRARRRLADLLTELGGNEISALGHAPACDLGDETVILDLGLLRGLAPQLLADDFDGAALAPALRYLARSARMAKIPQSDDAGRAPDAFAATVADLLFGAFERLSGQRPSRIVDPRFVDPLRRRRPAKERETPFLGLVREVFEAIGLATDPIYAARSAIHRRNR